MSLFQVSLMVLSILTAAVFIALCWQYWQERRNKATAAQLTNAEGVETSVPKAAARTTDDPHWVFGDPTLTNLGFGNIDPIVEPAPPKPATYKPLRNDNQSTNKVTAVLVLYVVPEAGEQFVGYELLQSLLSVGLRYGSMNIFHRHETMKGQGRIIFSAAQALEPGTFDLSRIGGLQCSGLSLFINLADTEDAMHDFSLMLECAEQLADDLHGHVLDEQRVTFSPDKINSYHERIIAYQRDQLAVDRVPAESSSEETA